MSLALAMMVMMLTVAVSGPTAAGQGVEPFEPRYVVITEENVPLKAGPASVHYAVAMLKSGQVLRADGQTSDDPVFLRVEYPRGVSVFVKAEEAELTGDDEQVRLTVDSRLRAANLSGGERGHWWFLLLEDAMLPAGTTLEVERVLTTPENRVYGYFVEAPAAARGFVSSKAVRDASPAEVESHLKALAAASAPEGAEAAETAPAETAPPAGATPPVVTAPDAAPSQPAEAPGAEQADPVQTPVEQPVEQPVATDPVPVDPAPAVDAAAGPAEQPAAPTVATLESLESLFNQAQAQPLREAELSEVIAEFNRSIGALGTTTEDQQTKVFLNARLELLKLRAELQRSIREAEALAGTAAQSGDRYANQVTALDQSRSYTVVGRLMPSTVYDGRRLPKMYRVQSVDEGFSRTVAYVMPRAADTDLEAKVGRVVGIVGQTQLDPALRVNIVRPERVEVLTAAGTGMVPAPAPAPANGG